MIFEIKSFGYIFFQFFSRESWNKNIANEHELNDTKRLLLTIIEVLCSSYWKWNLCQDMFYNWRRCRCHSDTAVADVVVAAAVIVGGKQGEKEMAVQDWEFEDCSTADIEGTAAVPVGQGGAGEAHLSDYCSLWLSLVALEYRESEP